MAFFSNNLQIYKLKNTREMIGSTSDNNNNNLIYIVIIPNPACGVVHTIHFKVKLYFFSLTIKIYLKKKIKTDI